MARDRLRVILGLVLAVGLLAATTTEASAATTRTFFRGSFVQNGTTYPTPAWSWPTSWRTFAAGQAKLTMQVTSKPTTKAVRVQVCFWRNRWTQETCSPSGLFSAKGTYTFDLRQPGRWWKKNGVWDWSRPPQVVRIMLKDAATGQLLMSRICSPYCYRGSDLYRHLPIRFNATMTVTS